ncbi:glycine oxidase ThiO [Alkalihalobacillus pseudalcaliphilus]|uniref:glycine oxidase ThiO n=1 Tax=Alkalihalobacillus pseudalcaliphilus TaxID=79884 RepID=UPI00064E130B|nr:glycine oxidase ThiO [Alkalihalobacillus pseudalcaliphilus]KMK76661.1 glycine oxidase [Alkalihalobacillus pseudalcaliphilus]
MSRSVIVIGGGVIGLSIAYQLQRNDFQVTLLEKGRCGGQASGAAAGMLAPFSEIGEDQDDFFRLCVTSLGLFKEWQSNIKEDSNIDFEFSESGSLHVVFHEADVLALKGRLSWQKKWATSARMLSGEEARELEPALSKEVLAAMYYPEESHVYAPAYVKSLEEACRKVGVKIIEDTGQIYIHTEKNSTYVSAQNGGTWQADEYVCAQGAWGKELEETLGVSLPIFPIRGQICAYQGYAESVNHIVYSSQGYLVPKENGTLINGASEDIAGFQTTVTEKGIERLTNWNHKLFPFLKEIDPFHTWAGLRPATLDGYPLIGKLKEHPHITVALGHYRNGILLSPVTAHIVTSILKNEKTITPIDLFNPERFS